MAERIATMECIIAYLNVWIFFGDVWTNIS